jgi:hypothetical protein
MPEDLQEAACLPHRNYATEAMAELKTSTVSDRAPNGSGFAMFPRGKHDVVDLRWANF